MRIILFFAIVCVLGTKYQADPFTIKHSQGTENIVVSAPHGGYEVYTATMAKRMAQILRCGCVVATGYRSPKNRRWINVNRPSECVYTHNQKGSESITERATEIYQEYRAAVYNAAIDDDKFLLIELHGNNRKLYSTGEPLMVIELSSSNISEPSLKKFIEIYQQIISDIKPEMYVPVYINELNQQYQYQGEMVSFHWDASQTKEHGVFSSSGIYGFHFELPLKIRKEKSLRKTYTKILSQAIQKWWQVFNAEK